jgi:lysozyme family protein
MTAFERAIGFTLARELEHTTDPTDPGGDTWYGIARKFHPSLAPWPPTRAQAVAQYELEYWTTPGIAELPPPVAIACFDTAVNVGPSRAISMLQQALRVFDERALGPKTKAAVAGTRPAWLVGEFLARRLRYYATLDATEDRYELGWARRVLDLHALCLTLLLTKEIP